MNLADQLVLVADTYGAAKRRSRSRISTVVFNDGKRLDSVACGKDIGVRTFERAMIWFSDNWPPGVEWPAGVHRPKARAKEVAA